MSGATVRGLDHLQLAIPPAGESSARAFYGELLGLAELPKPAELAGRGGVWFALGTQALHLGIETPFVPARKAHPDFAGKTAVVGAYSSEGFGAYASTDSRSTFMRNLGFEIPKAIDQQAGKEFSVHLSDENLDLLLGPAAVGAGHGDVRSGSGMSRGVHGVWHGFFWLAEFETRDLVVARSAVYR